MALPARLETDVESLRAGHGQVDLIEDGARFLVVLRRFQLPAEYAPSVVDVMVMADYLYPQSAMDMFWTNPVVSCASGQLPRNADQMETHGGVSWQRWSWHYTGWNPSTHSLLTHLDVVRDRLRQAC